MSTSNRTIGCHGGTQPLTLAELLLRCLVKEQLSTQNKALSDYWKQRYYFKLCKLGDENTSFLHASASSRLRKNQIRVLHDQNIPVYSHIGKEKLLYDFYKKLLGTSTPVTWNFSLQGLYPSGPDLSNLDAMLTDEEIKQAIVHMRTDSSPGPDGFGRSSKSSGT